MSVAQDVAQDVAEAAFTPLERAAIEPPLGLTATEYCDRYVWLEGPTAKPGKYEWRWTPYAGQWLDDASDFTCRSVTLCTGPQVAKTTAMLMALIWAIRCDPAPMIVCMSRARDVHRLMMTRLRPIVMGTADLRRLLLARPKEFRKDEVQLTDECVIYTATGRSAASARSVPAKRVLMDEVDDYPLVVNKTDGTSAITLLQERMRTYEGSHLRWASSTPTTEDRPIWQMLSTSDMRRYYVPCPHCGGYQTLEFDRLRFEQTPAMTEQEAGRTRATYHCLHCEEEIADDCKPGMLEAGRWVQAAATISKDGVVSGARESDHRGYHLPTIYSPHVRWGQVAGRYRWAQADPLVRMQSFTNLWLALPWRDTVGGLVAEIVKAKTLPYKRGTLPSAAFALTAGVDVQQNGFFYVIRAWGADKQSWLVDHGYLADWGDVKNAVLTRSVLGEDGRNLMVGKVCIDTAGKRENEVYEMCRTWPQVLQGCKGQQKLAAPFYLRTLPNQGMQLCHVNTHHYKLGLMARVKRDVGRPGGWFVFEGIEDDYCKQLSAEHLVRTSRGEKWERKGHQANHYLDCEVLADVAADLLGVQFVAEQGPEIGAMPDPPQPAAVMADESARLRGAPRMNEWLQAINRPGRKW